MEGSEVFDAEDGFGVHGLQLGDLGSRETDGWREAAQVEYLAIPGRDLPVSRKMNVVWIGDEVEFAQDFLGRDAFPFGVAKAGERARLKELERENRELRLANEILK